jgi:polyhydroxybutyrate depolymerase
VSAKSLWVNLILLSSLGLTACHASDTESADIGGRTRQWHVHLPPGYKAGKAVPLLIVYHGRGGTAASMEDRFGLDPVTDREGFIAVYPEGVDRSWAAGVGTDADQAGVDDVAFTTALLDKLEQEYSIDTHHVVLAGFSNGAHMVHLLGCRLADRISAIVPVSGTLATQLSPGCRPARPLSVIEFHGTADPIDPYAGGPTGYRHTGSAESVDQGLEDWARRDGCSARSAMQQLPGNGDPFTVIQQDYLACPAGTVMRLYKITGAGHVWPGGPQYLPARYIGKATRAVDASSIIGDIVMGQLK